MSRRSSRGILIGEKGTEGFKLYVSVDPEIGRLYRSLIPKYMRPRATRYLPHITVMRREGTPPSRWERFDGMEVGFYYDSEVRYDDIYFWLNCWSSDLIDIRMYLGLPDHSQYTRPPTGDECFHCTIANAKWR